MKFSRFGVTQVYCVIVMYNISIFLSFLFICCNPYPCDFSTHILLKIAINHISTMDTGNEITVTCRLYMYYISVKTFLKSFEWQRCNLYTYFSNYISSVADWKNEGLCMYIYMMNTVHTSVVANTVQNMKFCTIRLKFLQFGCQCSKKYFPKREKQSLHCTTIISTKLVRKVNLAQMLYLYLLFSKVLSMSCLADIRKGDD